MKVAISMPILTGLIGGKLSHSFSPQIHARLADYEYRLFELEEAGVGSFLRSMKNREPDFPAAINVTIPYKKTVMPYLDEISRTAAEIGSVNTIVLHGGRLCGYNTDLFGFTHMLGRAGIDPNGKKTLVLGSGGASVTASAALKRLGASEVVVISRSGEDNYENIAKHADASIIINTTPVGMYPNNGFSPLSLDIFQKLTGVGDLIYNPRVTKLLYDAQKAKIRTAGGLSMLASQAKLSSDLFLGAMEDENKAYDGAAIKLIDDVTESVSHSMNNLLLVGMPGSGKSSVGAALAKICGRPFVDTDQIIAAKAGKSIPEIFAESGEKAFRELESAALSEVSKLSGQVIATGGGAVLSEENRRMMRQNSTVIWLDRPTESLPKEGRPLSLSSDAGALEKMYRLRMPLYLEVSDFTVKTGGPERIEYAAREIAEKTGVDKA